MSHLLFQDKFQSDFIDCSGIEQLRYCQDRLQVEGLAGVRGHGWGRVSANALRGDGQQGLGVVLRRLIFARPRQPRPAGVTEQWRSGIGCRTELPSRYEARPGSGGRRPTRLRVNNTLEPVLWELFLTGLAAQDAFLAHVRKLVLVQRIQRKCRPPC